MAHAPQAQLTQPHAHSASVRLAELVATLSLATDLGMSQPMEHGLRTCLLAVRLGQALRLRAAELRELYCVVLLRRVGCTGDSHELQLLFGDDLAPHARVFTLDFGRPVELIADMLRHAGAGTGPWSRLRTVAGALLAGPEVPRRMFQASCDVARRLAEQMGFAANVAAALDQTFERWDGRGFPRGIRGERLALSARIARVAEDAEVFHRAGGRDAAVALCRARAGASFDPQIAQHFCENAAALLAGLEAAPAWDAVLAAEPAPHEEVRNERLDAVLQALAFFADLKAPHMTGHSPRVAALAAAAAENWRLPAADITLVHRAALLHDLGRVGISASVWEKPAPLSRGEWEQVRLYPYYSERILARSQALAPLARLAGLNQERLDASGYPHGAAAAALPKTARLLSVADVYCALTEARPQRAALTAETAAGVLRDEVRAGRFDGAAVDAVLQAAGHRVRRRREWPAGLSAREVEVLRLIARGASNRATAQTLGISTATVAHHVQHIYTKIGVSTRAGATLFAMQHALCDATPET
ncbi:MAG TPA: HD domain-containing phosphohydrolase [Burkholderiaceae bacterium]|nr:HD domain-containing phosphohydrolase [Burkholderiaceae bacterium]